MLVAAALSVSAHQQRPDPVADDSVAVQADLPHAIGPGESVRVRVIETYTDPRSYTEKNGELVWDRTLGRPRNIAILPPGWYLAGVSVPAIISLDNEGR